MNIESGIAAHYRLRQEDNDIIRDIRAHAADPANLTLDDLRMYDDMHLGGREATYYLADKMNLTADQRVLDVGSGRGGPARVIADYKDVHVTGIDLTPAHKDMAEALSAMTGLENKTAFITGSALNMPFEESSFDAAYMIHVGMNIADKQALFNDVARVLKPGGCFAVYDITGEDNDSLPYPMPWSPDHRTSFVVPAQSYIHAMEKAGLHVLETEDRTAFALETLQRYFSLVKETATLSRLYDLCVAGRCVPFIITARRPV